MTNPQESKTIAKGKMVSREEVTPCRLNEKAMEQLHEIRVEKRHTQLMLERIAGNNDRSIDNERRRLQKRLIRIEQAERFVLSQSCNAIALLS